MKGFAMENKSTKELILEASLDLFSTYGFEATSISQIVEAVGIKKGSLYSHFESKQDILDTLIFELTKEYELHSIFAKADWENEEFTKKKKNRTVEEIIAEIKDQICYIIHDEKISKVRKMLTIEQFQNERLKLLQTKHSYDDVIKYNLGQIRFLIKEGVLIDEDAEIMASQLALPISMWTNLCDREKEKEKEVMILIDRHIRQFFRIYQKA